MFGRVWRWLTEADDMSTPPQTKDKLTLGDIDEMLRHHAELIHTDPDPLSRWARVLTADKWLDCRNRLKDLDG